MKSERLRIPPQEQDAKEFVIGPERVLTQAVLRLSEDQQRDAVSALLHSDDPQHQALAHGEWNRVKAANGEAATAQPSFELQVFRGIVQRVVRAMHTEASKVAAVLLASVIIDVALPIDQSGGLGQAEAAGLEQTEKSCNLRQAYTALLDIAEFLREIDPSATVNELPSYEMAMAGDTDKIFKDTLHKIQQHIATLAAGDPEYHNVLIQLAVNRAIVPPAFQPPLSLVEQWLRAETLTPDMTTYTPGVTGLEDLERSIKSGNETEIKKTIADLFVYNEYDETLAVILDIIEQHKVSPALQKALALKVASHEVAGGSNSAWFFYQQLQDTPLSQDREIELAFTLTRQEVTEQRNAFRYEQATPLKLPHLRTAQSLGAEVELVIHPFYDQVRLQDFGLAPKPDFSDSSVARLVIQDTAFQKFTHGLESGGVANFLRGVDLVEQYNELADIDPKKTYVVVLPKYETSTNPVTMERNDRLATQFAWLANAFYETSQPGKMYYVESQTYGSGYLFPEDLQILVQANPQARYTVSGESPKRCVSNAMSDFPQNRLQPDANGLSIDDRELRNFLSEDIAFKAEMTGQLMPLYAEHPPQDFAELRAFYEANQAVLQPYHQFTNRLFLPTINRNGAVLE